ncbi:MAG: NADH-quinone oxidoreductase subunit L [Elusimicrobiota bacterium]|jgi:NADH-quinone oxidoreductase subunit L
MVDYAYLIPLLPLAAAILIFFFGRWLPLKGAWLGIVAVSASLVLSIDLFMRLLEGSLRVPVEMSLTWFDANFYHFEWGLLLDGPSLVMLLVVTIVSLMVQIYSLGYMHGAPYFKRFYAYLSLFTFSMLGLVLANNYLQFFIGWEIMGACSYFLIGFEFEREAAAAAGNKAFLTTRLGDLGFYAGLLTIFFVLGTFNFGQIQNHLNDGNVSPHMAYIIALLLFCGAVGKSAQLPLHVWLPDAMEGPTPVSALIHAATMVAAGVYLVARGYGFFMVAPEALTVVAWVGGLTAVFAATIALTATDIKKVLAYSTISQLGYMMMGLGVAGYAAGLFHLTTHAAFKALLFLGAGSVIHAVHTNDLWKMGSLSKQMATTFLTFSIATAALAGIPPFAGFFSKEMILTMAYTTHHYALFWIACFTAFLTALYMTRCVALTFLGEPRERDRFAHAHESPWSMTIPLIALGLLSCMTGWLLYRHELIYHLFEWPHVPVVEASHLVTALALGSTGLGIFLGILLYLRDLEAPKTLARVFRPVYELFVNKWYVDELYGVLLVRPVNALAKALDWFDLAILDRLFVDGFAWMTQLLSRLQGRFDDQVVDGLVDGTGWSVSAIGATARLLQNGFVQQYLFIITVGFIALVLFFVK